ncbi:hypothetical protein MMPV_006430 [Pyropia vietnamensis]
MCSADPPPSSAPRPTPESDWRAFRARLIAGNAGTPPSPHPPAAWAHTLPSPEVGAVLLPTPGTFSAVGGQAYFDRAALLLLGHGDGGSWGVMLDRPLASTLGQALRGGGEALVGAAAAAAPLYLGGDVHTDAFFWLRWGDEAGGGAERGGEGGDGGDGGDDASQGGGRLGKEVLPGLWVSPVSLGGNGAADAATGRVVRGCAGWGDGQLQSEVDRGVWVVAACNGPALWGGGQEGMGRVAGHLAAADAPAGGEWAAAAAADEEGRGGGQA